MATKYDYNEVERILNETLTSLGPERFSTMKVTELEKVVRTRAGTMALPGRSQLRDAIHTFRTARWKHAAPKLRR